MQNITRLGRLIYALAIAALGIENLVCAWFRAFDKSVFPGQNVIPVLPFVAEHTWLVYLTGFAMLAAGICIAANVLARQSALFLGTVLLLFVIFLESTRWFAYGSRTTFFETLALSAAAFILAGLLPSRERDRPEPVSSRLITAGRLLFAISCVFFGIDHLLFIRFIAVLVPAWLPWHLFWAYFTGIAFIAAGLSIATKWMGYWAAFLLGWMFLLWFVGLHLPRSLGLSAASGPGAPHNPAEWSSAFIALAMCGGSWMCAQACFKSRNHD